MWRREGVREGGSRIRGGRGGRRENEEKRGGWWDRRRNEEDEKEREVEEGWREGRGQEERGVGGEERRG